MLRLESRADSGPVVAFCRASNGKCYSTPAPTYCRADARESERLPARRLFPYFSASLPANVRVQPKRKAGGPAATAGRALAEIIGRHVVVRAHMAPNRQSPFPSRPDFLVPRGGYIAAASGEAIACQPCQAASSSFGSRLLANIFSMSGSCLQVLFLVGPGTRCLCRSLRRGRRQSSRARLACRIVRRGNGHDNFSSMNLRATSGGSRSRKFLCLIGKLGCDSFTA